MKISKAAAALLLALALTLTPCAALAQGNDSFVCYGADLTAEQFDQVLAALDADLASDTLIEVTIDDEKALLSGVVDADKIGSRSLSSARVTLTGEGTGIVVTTHNIDWVTPSMYSSALATAGVENASISVAAPMPVSGTAALAGILKAYETAASVELTREAKAAAGSEMMLTGSLGDVIGTDQAVELLAMVKQAIADYRLDDFDTLRPYVVEGARQLGVSLTDAQIDEITNLGVRIARLDLDPEKLASQLNGFVDGLKKLEQVQQSTASFFDRAGEAIRGFFDWIAGWFR